MNEYDITLKEVLLDSAGLTLRQLTGLDVRSWRDIELPQVNNPRIDLLGETDAGALVHIELQSTNDPKMALRMLNYGLRVYEQHQKFPLQVVLYLGAAPLRRGGRTGRKESAGYSGGLRKESQQGVPKLWRS